MGERGCGSISYVLVIFVIASHGFIAEMQKYQKLNPTKGGGKKLNMTHPLLGS